MVWLLCFYVPPMTLRSTQESTWQIDNWHMRMFNTGSNNRFKIYICGGGYVTYEVMALKHKGRSPASMYHLLLCSLDRNFLDSNSNLSSSLGGTIPLEQICGCVQSKTKCMNRSVSSIVCMWKMSAQSWMTVASRLLYLSLMSARDFHMAMKCSVFWFSTTKRAGWVNHILIEDCSAGLDGICSCEETGFQLCSSDIWCYLDEQGVHMMPLPRLNTSRVKVFKRTFVLDIMFTVVFTVLINVFILHGFPRGFICGNFPRVSKHMADRIVEVCRLQRRSCCLPLV